MSQYMLPVSRLGYDRIVLRRSRNRNRIFHSIIPVLSTGTGICQYKSGSGRTGTGFFRIQSGSGKNRILRSDRNSGRNRNLTNAIPARTGIAENVKTDFFKHKDVKLGLGGCCFIFKIICIT